MPKITIIEDEQSILEMYRIKFQLEKFDVSVAKNGIEGLDVLEKIRPDIILLDLRMPMMSGDEMLRKLRDREWGTQIPVIILTNISRDEAPRTLWHLGVSEYIVKSHSTPQQVVDAVLRVLERQKDLS